MPPESLLCTSLLSDGTSKKMNQALIKKAKAVGSDLGFLS